MKVAAKRKAWKPGLLAVLSVLASLACAIFGIARWSDISNAGEVGQKSGHGTENAVTSPEKVAVKVVRPLKGAMPRITVQPGSVHAFESVQLFAKASGYLAKEYVDIGDRVRRNQVLAVVDVPEIEKQLQRTKAALQQAGAKVEQMKAQVGSYEAELEAAKAAVVQAETAVKSAGANTRFRNKQLQRMKELFGLKSIDERLVDESQERYEAAFEAEQAAVATVNTTRAQVVAGTAKIRKGLADVEAAAAEVHVVEADLEKTEVILRFATIVAPFDGVITHRSFFPGDFVRSAAEGGGQIPLFTVQRTDRMRVIVQIPDRDVPYVDPGDPAVFEIDALPEKKLKAKVSRIAQSEDAQTRLMRVEIDLENPTGKIRQGMFGRVAIVLDTAPDSISLPANCLRGKVEAGVSTVYVVKDSKAVLTKVRVGTDDGSRVEITSGLSMNDPVIVAPSSALADGAEVEATVIRQEPREREE